jgi:hypothetical protein
MSFTIYFPITITLIVLTLNAILVYSLVKLSSIGFPNITNDSCDIIPKFLIGVFITSGLFIFSLLPNCGCCSEKSSKLFRFITPLMYYGSYIAIITEIYLNVECITVYKNSTNQNISIFLTVLMWNFIGFSIIVHLMLLSFILSQCCTYCSKKQNNSQLPINSNETKPLIILD